MSGSRTHWDPFQGEISVETPDISHFREGLELPVWLKRLPLPLCALGLIWTFSQGWLTGDFPFVPVAVTTLAFASIFLLDTLENADSRRLVRRVRLAREKDWTYTEEFLEWTVDYVRSVDSDGKMDRGMRRVKPVRLKLIEARLPELTKPRAGAFVGTQLDGEFWGTSSADGQPLWIALGAMQMEAGLATGDLRGDSRGGRGGYGQFFSLLGAYRLDRKTGIRAAISPENIVSQGLFDHDIKTESVAFNKSFRVIGRALDENDARGDVAAKVLRLLTPATQISLLELKARYHNVGLVVEDDILFFMAQDRLTGGNATEGSVDRLLPAIIAEFETAKFSLKRYVE